MLPLDTKRAASIQTLVVDDEAWARRNLTVLLGRDADIASIIECGSGSEAIEQIKKSKPDLMFLDVQMPGCGGFDVLEMLGGDLPSTIIFVTAYDEYALRAFEAGALDYLLKPFDDARFRRALDRAKDKIAHYAPQRPAMAQRIVVKSRGDEKFIRVHRSSIVNLDRIHALELQDGGEYEVVLTSKVRLRLSRRYRKRLQDRMEAISARN